MSTRHKNPVIFWPAKVKSGAFQVSILRDYSPHQALQEITLYDLKSLAQETEVTALLGFKHVGMTGALHCGPPNEALV